MEYKPASLPVASMKKARSLPSLRQNGWQILSKFLTVFIGDKQIKPKNVGIIKPACIVREKVFEYF